MPEHVKQFDAVEMKRKAQERIRAKLKGMTKEQELAYWAEQSKRLAESRDAANRNVSRMREVYQDLVDDAGLS